MTLWVALASFVGAVIGAAVPAVVTLRGQRQQARTEWSHRLDRAVAALTSDSAVARDIGRDLLADLIESDLGSRTDRDLALHVSRTTLVGGSVDETGQPGDNGTDDEEQP